MIEAFIAADSETLRRQALIGFREQFQASHRAVIVTCRFGGAFVREPGLAMFSFCHSSAVLWLSGCTKLAKLKFPLTYSTRTHYMKLGANALIVAGNSPHFGDYMLWIKQE